MTIHNPPPMRIGIFIIAIILLASCARSVAPPVVLSAEEKVLITQLARDQFVVVQSMLREEDGYLTLRTQQGYTVAYYRLMPANDAKSELSIRRLDEALRLQIAWSEDHLGTGPSPRGISRP
jgi:hypothetical protein